MKLDTKYSIQVFILIMFLTFFAGVFVYEKYKQNNFEQSNSAPQSRTDSANHK